MQARARFRRSSGNDRLRLLQLGPHRRECFGRIHIGERGLAGERHFGDGFAARSGTEIAFAMNADTDCAVRLLPDP